MNNDTICKFVIKLRGDNVYDLYMGDTHIASCGYYESIIDELRKVMQHSMSNNRYEHGYVYRSLNN